MLIFILFTLSQAKESICRTEGSYLTWYGTCPGVRLMGQLTLISAPCLNGLEIEPDTVITYSNVVALLSNNHPSRVS